MQQLDIGLNMNVALWLTDIHLNFVKVEKRLEFYQEIKETSPACILISGDIGEACSTEKLLREMQNAIDTPIYFVAGNHDYYLGSIENTRKAFSGMAKENIHFLTTRLLVPLTQKTVLLGVDGFADGRYGDYKNTSVVLNDTRYIDEYKNASGFVLKFSGYNFNRDKLLKEMQRWADSDAKALKDKLKEAKALSPTNIIIVTHVPPFEECATYEGRISGPEYLPFYTCKAVGDVIDKFAKANKNIKILVLCGHTHDKCVYERGKNIKVMVGESEYRYPSIQCEIEYD